MSVQSKIFKKKPYSFYAVIDSSQLAGLITDWQFGDFLFVEHLAIREDMRNKGLGTKLLNKYLGQTKKSVVLEVERPEVSDMARRRVEFYKRLGFQLNLHDYIQPSYGEGKSPVPMRLMSYPSEIDHDSFIFLREKIHKTVYGCKKVITQL